MAASEILPQRVIALLPLSADPVHQWSEQSDLSNFLTSLFDIDAEVRDQAGRITKVNHSQYGRELFRTNRQKFIWEAEDFRRIALANRDRPIPDASIRIDEVIDFGQDAPFGLMAKHAAAWNGVVDSVLSDGAFASLSHAVEVRSELDCSILLAKSLYYKQALQV